MVDVFRILDADADEDLAAVQCMFSDGSSLIFTVWTDWSLRADHRTDSALPDYFGPPGESTRAIVEELHDETGAEVLEVCHHENEVGELMAVDIILTERVLTVRSYAGQVEMSVQ